MSAGQSEPDPWAKIPADAPTIITGAAADAEPLEAPQRFFDEPEQVLLQTRLRAVANLILMAFMLYLIRSYFVPEPDLRLFQAVNILVAAGVIALLRRRRLGLFGLRCTELVMFALLAAFLATNQGASMLPAIHAGNVAALHTALRSSALYWFSAIVAYGMLVPNTGVRAASVVAPLALAPIILTLALRAMYPMAAAAIAWTQVSDMALMLIVGSIAAVYGTHIITGLELEVSTARQLGQYRLKRLLGAGGMGDVYLAEHELLKRPCVVKLIRAGRADNPELLEHFKREVRTTASLTHWNTVEVWDYGATSDGTFYYVMEYLPGWNLADLVTRFGPLSPGRAVFLLEQVCGALAEAHSVGFLHRDVTPANIIATQKGGRYDVAKLLDFGLVKIVGGSHRARSTVEDGMSSANEYRAPEQAAGGVIDPRSDLYSLAAVGHYLLTGKPPAPASAGATPPREPAPSGVPADLWGVIVRGMSIDPDARFADANELAAALCGCSCGNAWTFVQAESWWKGESAAGAAPAGVSRP